MCRSVAAIIVGAATAFLVGFLNWTVFNFWEGSFHPIPPAKEAAIVGPITDNLEPGTWFFPGFDMAAVEAMTEAEQEKCFDEYSKLHEKGPVGYVILSPGSEIMGASTFAKGILFDLLGAAGIAMVLCGACGPFCCRWLRVVLVVTLITGLFYGALTNWMGFPHQFMGAMAADLILTWGIAALPMVAIMGGKGCCNKPTGDCCKPDGGASGSKSGAKACCGGGGAH